MPNTIDDIVKRLRQRDEYDAVLDHMNQLYGLAKSLEHEAADEIERLREALEDIADRFDLLDCELTQDARTARDIARAALKETGREADQ